MRFDRFDVPWTPLLTHVYDLLTLIPGVLGWGDIVLNRQLRIGLDNKSIGRNILKFETKVVKTENYKVFTMVQVPRCFWNAVTDIPKRIILWEVKYENC